MKVNYFKKVLENRETFIKLFTVIFLMICAFLFVKFLMSKPKPKLIKHKPKPEKINYRPTKKLVIKKCIKEQKKKGNKIILIERCQIISKKENYGGIK